jgi:hypothetical protein
MKISVVNFADNQFKRQQKLNELTAYRYGKADKVYSFSPEDIDPDFKEQNKEILSQKRGAGLWLWKPYFILKTLKLLSDGEYLFYCDSGAYFIDDIKKMIPTMEKYGQSIMGFELPLLERQFTKKETFVLLDYDNYENNQILATCILFKKNDFTIKFVEEWLKHAKDERIISPQCCCSEIKEFEDFRVHREDQSIFSILYHKHKLKSFRDVSQFGFRAWEYMWKPFYFWSEPWVYSKHKFRDCDYPQIIALYRNEDAKTFKQRECRMNFLYKLKIYNELSYKFYFWLKNITLGKYLKNGERP